MRKVRIVDINKSNLYDYGHCFLQNRKHPGYITKTDWLKKRLAEGLRYRLLATNDDKWIGFIEYAPGAKAWRAIKGKGYMIIHCIWTYPKSIQHKGYGKMLLDECLKDARKNNMLGVAVLTRSSPKGTFIARRDLFTKVGFKLVDTSPPDNELMVKKLIKSAPDPKFPTDFEKRVKRYGRGLTIIWADQCPYVGKSLSEMIETAKKRGIKMKEVELKSARDAQAAPTPYAVFSIIYENKVVADHMVSDTRFKNILKEIGL
ncbi:MAG: GNAT family N-acetyltransferase [candidate division WOR-3 bacterium]|nr:MAG: GNAT family N-acetyltransferase [candidate division WOR-3 bacterium]